ncbi:helix-turn-helix domain-containing protein [Rhizobium sp. ARZ01]|uniref:helix-turn-helix transcriptional regulator n=1 Tax=Rhizobium sp. ARZ01 TaxID=2769313 RepID=UPI001781ECD9|nr:AraC family transcriptional regulator [Rhizobium sp. ARZ01]MBD9374557.1 helix-turn-helix domain-containing protein [Rhizobium sp. ARZ01]
MEHAEARGRIDRRVLAGVGAQLRHRGVDPVPIGRRVGCPVIESDFSDPTVSLGQFVGFLEEAGRVMRDAAGIWQCGRAFVPSGLPELFPHFERGTRLGTVLSALVATMNKVQSGSIIRLSIKDSLALIEYRILDPAIWPRAFDVEFTFGFFDGVIRRYFKPDFRPESLVFEHEPGGRRIAFDSAFGLACVYGYSSNLFAFPAAMLSLPVLAEWPAGAKNDPPARSEFGEGLADRLRRAVLSCFGEGEMDQETIAEMVGLSARTLRRRLLEEGLTFRDEIERLRMEYAREMILQTNLPFMELASRLGYRQQSDFTRAFRRAEGIPPSGLRRLRSDG